MVDIDVLFLETERRSDTIHLHGDSTPRRLGQYAILGDVLLFRCSTADTQSVPVARRFHVASSREFSRG